MKNFDPNWFHICVYKTNPFYTEIFSWEKEPVKLAVLTFSGELSECPWPGEQRRVINPWKCRVALWPQKGLFLKLMWLLAEGGGRWWEGRGPWLRFKDFSSLSLWSRPQCIRPRWWWGGVGVLRGGLSALLKISTSSQGLSFAHVCLTGVCLGSRLQRQEGLRPTAPRAPEAGKVSP